MRSKAARRARPKGGMLRPKGGAARGMDADFAKVKRMLERGNMTGGLQHLNRLIRDNPDSSRLYAHKASVLAETGRLEEAEECCRKALKLDGNSGHACSEMGLILRRTGRPREAIPYYDRAIKIYKQGRDNVVLARVYSNKGTALMDMDMLEEARVCYDKSIKTNPNYVVGHANMGALLYRLDRIDDAVECFTAAKMLDPNFTLPIVKTD